MQPQCVSITAKGVQCSRHAANGQWCAQHAKAHTTHAAPPPAPPATKPHARGMAAASPRSSPPRSSPLRKPTRKQRDSRRGNFTAFDAKPYSAAARTSQAAQCGPAACFLHAEGRDLKFPVCTMGTCTLDCNALHAAYVRAASLMKQFRASGDDARSDVNRAIATEAARRLTATCDWPASAFKALRE